MVTRNRQNFMSGVASGVTATATTITGGLNNVWPTISGGTYMPVVFNPGYFGATGNPEIVYITATSGNLATVVRAQENTVAVTGTTVPWVAGPLVSDFDVANLTSSGILTLNNGLNVSNFVNLSGATTANIITITGTGSSSTIPAATITGALTARATVPGSQVIGDMPNATIPAANIDSGALQSGVTVSAAQIGSGYPYSYLSSPPSIPLNNSVFQNSKTTPTNGINGSSATGIFLSGLATTGYSTYLFIFNTTANNTGGGGAGNVSIYAYDSNYSTMETTYTIANINATGYNPVYGIFIVNGLSAGNTYNWQIYMSTSLGVSSISVNYSYLTIIGIA